jgi:hypothetical protein
MNVEFIIVGVIYIFILFVINYGYCGKVLPYSHISSDLPQYPYEGFSSGEFLGSQREITPSAIDPSNQKNLSFDFPRSELLQGADYSKKSEIIDTISHLPSRPDCIGNAGNLSNSTGGICFDDATLTLIKTRGNNQTY